MVRPRKKSLKITSMDCIFCGRRYLQNKMSSNRTNIDYVYVQPLGLPYRAVCISCQETTLRDFKVKYPDLFD